MVDDPPPVLDRSTRAFAELAHATELILADRGVETSSNAVDAAVRGVVTRMAAVWQATPAQAVDHAPAGLTTAIADAIEEGAIAQTAADQPHGP